MSLVVSRRYHLLELVQTFIVAGKPVFMHLTTRSNLAVPSATSVTSFAARSSWRSCFSLSSDNSSRLWVKASNLSSIVIAVSLLLFLRELLCECSSDSALCAPHSDLIDHDCHVA